MRFAGITGILRLPPKPLAGAVDVVRKMSLAAIAAAAALTAAPAEYDAGIARALTLPVKDALRTLDSLSSTSSAPGWAKAKSLKLLGDHQFIKTDYKKAADFYLQASKFDNSSMYRHLYAIALAADGQAAKAAEIWGALAGDPADPVSGEAAQLLASIQNQQAATVNTQNKPPESKSPEPPASVDNQNIAAVPNQQPAAVNSQGKMPEISQNKAPEPPASVDNQNIAAVPNQQPPAVSPQNKGPVYTVQVGAFGSKENADNLVKKLSDTYKDITISPTASGDQTLYRVRIGTFQNREDAVTFADKLITTAGLSARVFEK